MKSANSNSIVRFLTFSTIRSACSIVAVLAAAGCCSVNKDAAGKLASEGASVANTVSQSYQTTLNSLSQYIEGEYLLSALRPGASPPDADMLRSIQIAQNELQARQDLFRQLGGLYASFGNLCSYDAKGEVEKSLASSIQSVNSFSQVLGGGSISDSTGKLVAAAGGEIVGQMQCARIKDASQKIRAVLSASVFLLQKAQEKDTIIAVRSEISRGKLKVAEALWTNDMGLATGILSAQVEAYGLVPNDQALAHASANAGLREGVNRILKWRQTQEQSAEVAAYDASIHSLQSLLDEHTKIEKGAPVNLATIQGYLSAIQRYADLLSAVEKGK